MLITRTQVLLNYQKSITDSKKSTEVKNKTFMNNIISKSNYWDNGFYKNNCVRIHIL